MLFSIPAPSICQTNQKIALPFALPPPYARRLTIIKPIIAAKKPLSILSLEQFLLISASINTILLNSFR
jgi:hypothetical protein